MEKQIILKMVDGGIINIDTDQEYWSGCDTCDYGSQYINEVDVELTQIKANIKVQQMYDYPFSVGDVMKIVLNNVDGIKEMREKEFVEWLCNEFDKLGDKDYSGFEVNCKITDKKCWE